MKYTAVKNIDTAIQSVLKAGTKYRELVQNVAVAVLIHAEKHGDYRKANDLVEALGQGVKGALLVKWFETFGGLIKSTDKEQKGFNDWKGAQHIRDNFQQAKAEMWWIADKADSFTEWDANEQVAKFLKAYGKYQRVVQSGKAKDGDKINVELNASMIQALANLINFEPVTEQAVDAANETTEKPKAKREAA